MNIIDWLKGKKSYFLAVAAGIATFAWYMKWIDQHTYEAIIGFLGAGSIAALRAGIGKIGK